LEVELVHLVVSYPAKVQIFQLITTKQAGLTSITSVVSYPAKVQIFQLITTQLRQHLFALSCFLPCKGTNFSANYNVAIILLFNLLVVSYPAKVQIFQLITTPCL